MEVSQELVRKIREYFSLNIYETKVWIALVRKGTASAGEVSEISGVPRSRTYDVLEGLEKRGFVIQKIGKPVKYLAVKPNVILEKLKNDTLSKAKEKVETLSKLKTTDEYDQLETLYNESLVSVKREDLSASLKGRLNIFNHLRDILESAETQVIVCTNARDLIAKPKIFQPAFERLTKRKVELKIFLKGSDEELDFINKKFKVQVNKTELTGKFFVIDKKQTLFIITDNSSENEIGIWLNTEFFSGTLAELFEIATKTKKKKGKK
jgi:sugar-specific transcriptional regulator TrmB